MAEAFKLRQLLVADETTFASTAESGTPTWSVNLPIQSASLELRQDRIPDGSLLPRLADTLLGHPGARSATLKFTTYAVGHLTTAAGALSETWQQQLIGDGLGGNVVTEDGGTVSAAASISTVSTATVTWVAGGVYRFGSKGDGQGDGQAYVVSAATANLATLINGFSTVPDAEDVIYACQVAHHTEGATLTTKRFMMLHATTGAQYAIFGAQLAGLKFNYPFGELPTVEFTYEAAYWRQIATSFPDSTALGSPDCAPVAGGTFVIQDVGTKTRSWTNASEVTINYDLGLSPIMGPGGANMGTYQNIVGWQRTKCEATVEVTIPWVDTYQTWWDLANQSMTYKYLLFTANPTDGRAIGFFCPRVLPTGNRPTIEESNDQNYQRIAFRCRENSDTTSDLTRSAVRFFAG